MHGRREYFTYPLQHLKELKRLKKGKMKDIIKVRGNTQRPSTITKPSHEIRRALAGEGALPIWEERQREKIKRCDD
jgi:hypothetical protein